MSVKTLGAFRALGRKVDLTEGSDLIGVDVEYWSGTDVDSLMVYDEAQWIEIIPGEYGLMIGRDYWTGPLADMESRLFFDHYVSECANNWTVPELAVMLREWVDWRASMTDDDAESRFNWLEWFCWRMDEVTGGMKA